MIKIIRKKISNYIILLYILENDKYITFNNFLYFLYNKHFVKLFSNILKNIEYDFYFECSKITNLSNYFVIALIKTYFPNKNIDLITYQKYFESCNSINKIVSFNSLSNNTRLICPYPENDFIHFKRFLQLGTDEIIFDFFQTLINESISFLTKHKILYLKTHGHSVNYFHFRLQSINTYNNFKDITNYIPYTNIKL